MQNLFRLRRWRMTAVVLFVVITSVLMTTGNAMAVQPPNQGVCAAGWMGEYNLITTSFLNTSSDVEGTTFVGGDFTGTNSANFANQISGYPATSPSLEIAGNVVSGNPINVQNGSVRVGSGNTVVVGPPNVAYDINGRRFNVNSGNSGGTAAVDSGLTAKASQINSELQSWSTSLSGLVANNSVTPPASPSALNFIVNNVDSNGVAVFNVSGAAVFNNGNVQQIEIVNTAGATAIIINVSGTNINFSDGNFVGSFLTSLTGRANTLWNFYEATTINFGSKNFMGALLAPLANVTTTGNIDGATAVKSLTTSAEVHLPLLDISCDDIPVPGNGGNQDCPAGTVQVAKFNYQGGNYVLEDTNDLGNVVIPNGNSTGGNWSSNFYISAIVVKGGPNSIVDSVIPAATSGTFSNANVPVNGGGNRPAISNVKFCAQEPQPEPETGSITVYKQVLPIEADRGFDFTFTDGNTVTPFVVSDTGVDNTDAEHVFDDLPAGSYTIAEVLANLPENWSYNGATCATTAAFPPDMEDVVAFDLITALGGDGSVTVNLAAGKDIFCHFGNTFTPPNGTLLLQKVVEGDGDPNNPDQEFVLSIQNSNASTIGSALFEDGEGPLGLDLASDSYFVAESDLADNWTLTDISCVSDEGTSTFGTFVAGDTSLSVELVAGDRVVCTFTNEFTPPTGSLEVTKVVDLNGVRENVNQTFEICISGPSFPNGNEQGACQEADFDGSTLTWTDLLPGDYTVSETDPGDLWTTTGEGNVSVASGQTATVEITNTHDEAGAIFFRKVVSGEGDPENPDQTFIINVASSVAGRNFGSGNVLAGSNFVGRSDLQPVLWTISERDIPEGWTLDNIVCTSTDDTSMFSTFTAGDTSLGIDLAPGDRVNCTLTNSFPPPTGTITVSKDVIGEGADEDQQFQFFLDGSNGNEAYEEFFYLSESGIGSPEVEGGVLEDLPATSWGLSEFNLPDDYVVSDIQCTSENGNSNFTYDINAAFDESLVIVSLATGDHVHCTFINEYVPPQIGTITVSKDVIGLGADEDQQFRFFLDGTSGNEAYEEVFYLSESGIGSPQPEGGVFEDLPTATWAISELNLPDDYVVSDIQCISENGNSNIQVENVQILDSYIAIVTLATGDHVHCTFINEYVGTPPTGSITIIKNVVGDDFSDLLFDFTFDGTTDFQLSENSVEPFFVDGLEAGIYNVSEIVPEGWDLTSISCGVNNNQGAPDGINIVLEAGEDEVCTFNNTPPASTLRIVKEVPEAQAGSAPNFEFSSSVFEPDPQVVSIGINGFGATGQIEVEPGDYSVEEVNIPNGWYLVSIDCGDAPFTLEGDYGVSVTVGAGEDVICTFVNELRGNIIIEKDVTEGDEDQVFDFMFEDFNFPLSETGGEDGLFDALVPDSYTITEENLPANWTLDDVVCSSTGENSSFTDVDGGVTVDLASGEDVTCVFENSYEAPEPEYGLIKVFKYYDVNENGSWFFEPPLYGFEFVVYDELGNQVAPSQTTGLLGFASFLLPAGNYTVCELLPQGWTNTEPGTIDATYNQPCVEVHLGEYDLDLVSFGNREAEPGSIRVTKFNDLNINGDRDNGEARLEGWTFEVYEGNTPVGSPIRSNETNSNGRRTFNNLEEGTYTVCEVMQEGWTNTTPLCQTVEVVSGERTDIEFGNIELPPVTDTCGAIEVVSFNQGSDRNFNPIVGARSNALLALGAPQNNDTINFVSLGFGGELILELDGLVVDDNGGDFDLYFVETSFGNPSHASYPESVEIFISLLPNGPWTSIGSLTQDGGLDFPGDGASALYVRLVDTSNRNSFSSGVADGYDLDGILCDEPDGEIVVTKVVDWNGAEVDQDQTFTLCVSGDNLQQPLCESVNYDGGTVSFDVEPGHYSVYEYDPGDGWTVAGQNGNVNVASGQTRHITITNTHDEPTVDVTLIKTLDWNGNEVNNAVSFELCIDGLCGIANYANSYTVVITDVPLGIYTLSETPAANWTVSFPNGTSAEVTLNGSNTFTVHNTADAPPPPPPVEQVGTIRVTKNVVTPPAEHGDFTICIQGAVFPEDQQNQPACYLVHNNGDQVSWNVVIPTDQQSASYTIVENNPGANWSVDGSGASVTVYPDQTSYHTITNTYNAPPPPSCEGGMGPQSHLSGVITISGSTAYGTVYNNSDVEDCQYQIGMASYSKYDDIIDNQVLFAGFDTIVTIPAGGSVELSIALPECAVQVDLFYGTFLPNLNGQRYGSRLLAYVHHGGNYCEAPQQEQPPVEEQQPPVEEQQPPVEEQQPPVEEQQPPVEEQQPPVEEQQPPVEEQQPPAEEQQQP